MSEPVLARDNCGTPSTTTTHHDEDDDNDSLSHDALKGPVVQIKTSVEVCYHDLISL